MQHMSLTNKDKSRAAATYPVVERAHGRALSIGNKSMRSLGVAADISLLIIAGVSAILTSIDDGIKHLLVHTLALRVRCVDR